jgi:hypothetical protein
MADQEAILWNSEGACWQLLSSEQDINMALLRSNPRQLVSMTFMYLILYILFFLSIKIGHKC